MGYVRITIKLHQGASKSGIRHFPEPMNLSDIKQHAWQLSAESLGRGKIADVLVEEVPADDPGVVALILRKDKSRPKTEPSNGEHPYVKYQKRKPPR
jgi:hypothetical protein